MSILPSTYSINPKSINPNHVITSITHFANFDSIILKTITIKYTPQLTSYR